MRRRRKHGGVRQKMLIKFTCGIRKLIFTDTSWIFIACLAGVLPPSCSGVHVSVNDEKRYAIPFQSVVLPCHYSTVSTQTAVVQWVYKSYCRDRTRDSFSFPDSLGRGLGGGALQGNGAMGRGYETGPMPSYLDCSDSSRTVRTVASISGSSVTLSEFYKNRDISIINAADLQIGEVQWGDSGVYFCKVIISDDLEGHNEASVELLVLGFSAVPEDLLPDFDLKIMPEWVFVAAVVLGSVLFLLLVGVCWCQCCPHSCCCYVSCWCCPDTCCCPRHLYEAGKGIKTGSSTPQSPTYPPYFVSGLPAMVPIAPPSLVDKVSSLPPSDGSLIAAACSPSEVSSLHTGENGFRQTYLSVQKNALPAIPDQDSGPEPQGYRENRSPEPQRHRNKLSSPHRYCHDAGSDPRDPQDEPLLPRRYSDDPPSSSQSHRRGRNQLQQNSDEEDKHKRWNPRSEHLHRKTYRSSGETGSRDELEEFAASNRQRGGRGAERKEEERVDYEVELLEFSQYPSYRNGPPQHYHSSDHEPEDGSDREDTFRHNISPLSSPKRKGDTRDRGGTVPPPPTRSPPPGSSREKDYDPAFLDSLLYRKARLRGIGQGKGGAWAEEESDTPSKKSSRESSRHCGHSPANRSEARSVPLSESDRTRTDRPSPRPLPANSRSSPPSQSSCDRREEPRDKSRKVNPLLSRDSLIV